MDQKPGTKPNARNPKLLMAIKLAHYFTLIAQGGVTWTILQVREYLVTQHHFTAVAVFLLALGSVYQAMAGAFFIMAHEYDGWQIAHFKWPDAESAPNPAKYDNDRLRLVAYQMLFWFQGLGMGMGTIAVLIGKITAPAPAAVTAAVWSVLGLEVPPFLVQAFTWFASHVLSPVASLLCSGPGMAIALILFYVATPWFPTLYGRPETKALLVPRNTLIGFIFLASCYLVALCFIIPMWAAILAVVLFSAGGLTEGLISESIFDQTSHLAAVVVISLGCVTLIHALSAAASVPALWSNSEVQRFLAVLAVGAGAMIANSKQLDK